MKSACYNAKDPPHGSAEGQTDGGSERNSNHVFHTRQTAMSLAYFRFYPNDFEADTAHLTLAEDGAYNRLLRLCWRTPGCNIPDDDDWIKRRMRVSDDELETVVRPVLAEFFHSEKQRVSNKRLNDEYAHSVARHKIATENGRKGGRQPKPLKTGEEDISNGKAKTSIPSLTNQNQNQNQNKRSKKTSKKEGRRPVDVLADVLGQDIASEFIAHRQKLRKPMTTRAAELMAKKLAPMADPARSAEQSIANGWVGVFPVEENQNNGGAERARSIAREWEGRVDRGPHRNHAAPLLQAKH